MRDSIFTKNLNLLMLFQKKNWRILSQVLSAIIYIKIIVLIPIPQKEGRKLKRAWQDGWYHLTHLIGLSNWHRWSTRPLQHKADTLTRECLILFSVLVTWTPGLACRCFDVCLMSPQKSSDCSSGYVRHCWRAFWHRTTW